jgi:hypothetical protein
MYMTRQFQEKEDYDEFLIETEQQLMIISPNVLKIL